MAAWMDQPRTLAELEALPGEVLTCQQIAPILGANPAQKKMDIALLCKLSAVLDMTTDEIILLERTEAEK